MNRAALIILLKRAKQLQLASKKVYVVVQDREQLTEVQRLLDTLNVSKRVNPISIDPINVMDASIDWYLMKLKRSQSHVHLLVTQEVIRQRFEKALEMLESFNNEDILQQDIPALN